MTEIGEEVCAQEMFAQALRDPGASLPRGLIADHPEARHRRFSVYRNNVRVGLISALEARFAAVRKITGDDFFRALAGVFASAHVPGSPLMMFYGDDFPAFIEDFEPARDLPYLADVARLEAARTRAYHAADATPLQPAALQGISPEDLGATCFKLHPSLEIITSIYPIVTVWAMNADETLLAPITDWRGEDALVVRLGLEVEVRRLPPGGKEFLQCLGAGCPLNVAAASAQAAQASFDLAQNLAALFAGLAVEMANKPSERPPT